MNANFHDHKNEPARLIVTWIIGLIVGTFIVATTSPWFVRSYLPNRIDRARGTSVPVSGKYRWRSEGYATTAIGPHGMPGRAELPPKSDEVFRIALWGDSQAEGVCIPDDQKLFSQIQLQAGSPVEVLPFARSGQSASDWLAQIPVVEQKLDVDAHVILIADLPDLITSDVTDSLQDETTANSKIAALAPAFLIQAARYLLTDTEGNRRRMRFSVGPTPINRITGKRRSATSITLGDPLEHINAVRQTSELPITIVYAPKSPSIIDGKVRWDDPHADDFRDVALTATNAGIKVIDASSALRDSAQAGRWPHGFQNGQFGSGHLNGVGYRVIAAELARHLSVISDQERQR